MSKIKVLVVDDEAGITRMLKRNLEATTRFEVRTENVSKQALAAAREFGPDLVVLDVMMPDMDGGEVAAALKDDAKLAKVPVIFLSAIVKPSEVQAKGGKIGGRVFLAKPVQLKDLVACIDRLLGTPDAQPRP